VEQTPDEEKVEFPFAAAELVGAIGELPRMRWFLRAQIALAIGFLVYFLARIGRDAITRDLPFARIWPSLLVVCLTAAMIGLGNFWGRRFDLRRFRRQKPEGTMEILRFGQKGLTLAADAPLTPWGLIASITETSNGFLIADAASTAWTFAPRNAFSPAQLERLRTIAREEFKTRPKLLKLLPSPSPPTSS
jgi:hypothetical protein